MRATFEHATEGGDTVAPRLDRSGCCATISPDEITKPHDDSFCAIDDARLVEIEAPDENGCALLAATVPRVEIRE